MDDDIIAIPLPAFETDPAYAEVLVVEPGVMPIGVLVQIHQQAPLALMTLKPRSDGKHGVVHGNLQPDLVVTALLHKARLAVALHALALADPDRPLGQAMAAVLADRTLNLPTGAPS